MNLLTQRLSTRLSQFWKWRLATSQAKKYVHFFYQLEPPFFLIQTSCNRWLSRPGSSCQTDIIFDFFFRIFVKNLSQSYFIEYLLNGASLMQITPFDCILKNKQIKKCHDPTNKNWYMDHFIKYRTVAVHSHIWYWK